MTVYINKLPCVRDAQGSEAGAKHGSEADPEAARPERSEGNALIYSNNNLKHQTMSTRKQRLENAVHFATSVILTRQGADAACHYICFAVAIEVPLAAQYLLSKWNNNN